MSRLDSLFSPKRIAVVGASRNPQSISGRTLQNISSNPGVEVYAVNPSVDSIDGIKAYPSVGKIPGKIDLAIVVTNNTRVPDAVLDCANSDVGAVIVGTSGFSEAGPEGRGLEKRLCDIVSYSGIPLLGPNCMGLYNMNERLNLTISAGFSRINPGSGSVALITQSGAFGIGLVTKGLDMGVRFSKMISLGNKLGLNDSDILEYLAEDPYTDTILIYAEQIKQGRRFYEVAKEVSKRKPVVIYKVGKTQQGSRVAMSHTGALANDYSIESALFRQAGMIEVGGALELLTVGRVLSKSFTCCDELNGKRVGIVTNSGGQAAEVADLCSKSEMTLPILSPELQERLRVQAGLPTWGATGNPIDLGVGNNNYADWYCSTVEMLHDSGEVDAILVLMVGVGFDWGAGPLMARIRDQGLTKIPIILVATTSNSQWGAVLSSFSTDDFLVVDDVSHAATMLDGYFTYNGYKNIHKLQNLDESDNAVAKVNILIPGPGNQNGSVLGEVRTKAWLSQIGMNLEVPLVANNAEDAVQCAESVGYPVVMKTASESIVHKSDVGGVKVNLRTADEVSQAYESIMENIAKTMPEAVADGVTLQPFVQGTEFYVGYYHDENYGPLLSFGLGGVLIEFIGDISWGAAPLDSSDARRMIDDLRYSGILDGIRGMKPVDRDKIAALLTQLSVIAGAEELESLDLNPCIVDGNAVYIADARAVLCGHYGGGGV